MNENKVKKLKWILKKYNLILLKGRFRDYLFSMSSICKLESYWTGSGCFNKGKLTTHQFVGKFPFFIKANL